MSLFYSQSEMTVAWAWVLIGIACSQILGGPLAAGTIQFDGLDSTIVFRFGSSSGAISDCLKDVCQNPRATWQAGLISSVKDAKDHKHL